MKTLDLNDAIYVKNLEPALEWWSGISNKSQTLEFAGLDRFYKLPTNFDIVILYLRDRNNKLGLI